MHRYWRDKLRVTADESIVFNDGTVFVDAIVIASDGSRANVDALAYGGIAYIRQMVDF